MPDEGYDATGTNYLEHLITFAESEVKGGKTKDEFLTNKFISGITEWKVMELKGH